jgi:hypothetical protein
MPSDKKGWVNGYRCDGCKDTIWTILADAGTTPMLINCEAKEGCRGMMHSTWGETPYPVEELHVRWEWFKPDDFSGYDEATRQHLEAGGLELRRVPCSRGDDESHTNPPPRER